MRPAGLARARRRAERSLGLVPSAPGALAAEMARALESYPALADAAAEQMRHALESVLHACPRLQINLPGPPKPKGRPRAYVNDAGQPRVATPKGTRRHESALKGLATLVAHAARWPLGGYPGARYVLAADYVLAGDEPDLDNLLKSVDGLNKIVWSDDRRVAVGLITKRLAGPGERPRTELTIWAIVPTKNEAKP